jgi:CRISPR-associated protein Csm1
MPKETLAIALDALLHGFDFDLADRHTDSSVERRHVYKAIITRSLQLASSGADSRPNGQSARLRPVFDRIELKPSPHSGIHYFSQKPLVRTSDGRPLPIFPTNEPEPVTPSDYFDQLQQSLGKVCEEMKDDLDCLYTRCLSLLQQFAWCIPADHQPGPPDISLYDQARVVSAIAACLHKHHESFDTLNENDILREGQTRCVLLAGDVSGIQDYIFAISTTGAGGVAKRLRARSFYVQMLSDVSGLRLLGEFDLPLANLLMASGGNFHALLPDLPDTAERMEKLQREFNTWLLDRFHGALTISLASTKIADHEFADGNYSVVIERLHQELRLRKAQRLAAQLQNDSGWRQEFVRQESFGGASVCLSCSRFPATRRSDSEQSDPDICIQCFDQQKLGRELTKAEYLSFYRQGQSGYDCLGWKFDLSDSPPSAGSKPSLVIRLNNPDLTQTRNLPAAFRYLANHIPHEDREPWTFTDIAAEEKLEEETTTKMLGVLKADVDHLGQIFQEGLRRDAPGKGSDSLARVATLSRQLDWFFSGWLEWLLTNEFPSCYAVYSGGDDLLIVGPRAKSLELARRINEEFAHYTGNLQITMSAGIAVVKPKLPLAHTVKLADKALEKAKGDDDAGRNSICVLDDVIKWLEFEEVFQEIGKLKAMSQDKAEVPSRFLNRLIYLAELRRDQTGRGWRYHPLLSYQIERTLKKGTAIRNWAEKLLEYPPKGTRRLLLDHLRLLAQWVILERRDNNGAE